MKKWFQKGLALTMAMSLFAVTLTGCGAKKEASSDGGFSVTFGEPTNVENKENLQHFYDRLNSLTDVTITYDLLSAGDGADALKLRFASGDYPEVIMGNFLQTSDVSKYAANGILLPLDEYINETDTPNIYKFFEDYPKSKAANYLPDGHMYSLPQFVEYEPQYLENTIFINKTWLDKLNLEIPKTMDDLLEVLRAFKTGDPNGNGQADEIGMSFLEKSGYQYPEALLSCWGVAAKSGAFDSYCTVRGGKVSFAPMMEEWKKMIKYYNTLYSEGLLDMECFTHNNETFNSKMQADTSKIGVIWSQTCPMKNKDEYIAIEPLVAEEGVKPVWHIHPGIIGNRNVFSITNKCQNPKAVMQWVDKMFTLENSLQNMYGEIDTTIKKNDDGTFRWIDPPAGKTQAGFQAENRMLSWVACIRAEDIGTKIEMSDLWKQQGSQFELYKDFIDQEPWPRPYYSVEEANRISELTTDIFKLVDEKKAKWITGAEDVDKDWESYKQSLENMGISELMEINQKAYDRYTEKMPK